MTEFFLLGGLFLLSSTIMVPIATKLKMGSVLGYIIAGILLSPILALLNVDVVTLQHFAEFGVVMMLFLVGLELEPKVLWQMRAKLVGLGGLQVTVTAALVTMIAMAFGLEFKTALAIGFVFSLSSTAIVIQTLSEKGLMGSNGGKDSFSVLLVQDIVFIPMLAILPLLALPELAAQADSTAAASHASYSLVSGLSGLQRAGVTILAVASIVFLGIKLSGPFFNFAASAKLREILVAKALLWVFGISLLMSLVELSPALGTFIAGVVLANSEYRHQIESDIDPFKGLLLGLFFITVGASIDFTLLYNELTKVLSLTFGLMALKALVLFGLSKLFKMRGSNKWLFTLGLAQAGEFAFVLLAYAVTSNVMARDLSDLLLLVVALSMLLTPLLFIFQEKFLSGGEETKADRDADEIEEQSSVVIAGHGRFGGIVNRMLRGLGYETTVLDFNYENLDALRTIGIKVYFGDATRSDLLHSAGLEKAEIFVIAIDEKEQITELVKYCTKHYPNLHVIARAVDRHHVYDLYAAGCRDIIRESFDSSVRAGRSALEAMGIHPFEAERKARNFVKMDQEMMVKLASVYKPDVPFHQNKEYVKRVQEVREDSEAELRGKDRRYSVSQDRAWSPPTKEDVETVIDEVE